MNNDNQENHSISIVDSFFRFTLTLRPATQKSVCLFIHVFFNLFILTWLDTFTITHSLTNVYCASLTQTQEFWNSSRPAAPADSAPHLRCHEMFTKHSYPTPPPPTSPPPPPQLGDALMCAIIGIFQSPLIGLIAGWIRWRAGSGGVVGFCMDQLGSLSVQCGQRD